MVIETRRDVYANTIVKKGRRHRELDDIVGINR